MATSSFSPDGSANCNVSVSTDADQHPGVPTEANLLAFISLSLARRDRYGQASGLDSVGDMHRR